ncbi:MAG: glycosyltransferase, partial [Bryobacterales bacterium]|nr:glycosyltransferase [Bryobacterales bacterium]
SASAAMAAGLLLHRRLLRTYERCVTKIICLTEFQRQKLVASGLSASQLVVKDNQVIQDPSQFGAPRNERTGTYLYTGRLSPEKGVDLLLHAWRSRTRQGTRLVIAGDGPEHQHLRSIVAGRDDVEMLGWQDQASVRALMRRPIDCFLPVGMKVRHHRRAHAQGTLLSCLHMGHSTLVSGVNGLLRAGDARPLKSTR